MADVLHKNFNITSLKILKKLKEDVKKVKKTIYEQNGNINEDAENLKRSQKEFLELKSTVTKMKKFTGDIQRQISAGRRKHQPT